MKTILIFINVSQGDESGLEITFYFAKQNKDTWNAYMYATAR